MTPSPTTLRIAGDARLMAGAGYALMLQVAHPVVSAGVDEHSNFRADPFGRLIRTLDYVNVSVFAGDEAAARMGARTREMHKRIKGRMPDGTHYHSLDPVPFAWVHATLVHSIMKVATLFGDKPTRWEREVLYQDWREIGEHIGVRPRDLPDTLRGFETYVRDMYWSLERTVSVDTVLKTIASPIPPDLPYLGERSWKVARWPAARGLKILTLGLLGAEVRARLELPWSRADQLQFNAAAAASRAGGRLLPERARHFGPEYLRWRHDALTRQGFELPLAA